MTGLVKLIELCENYLNEKYSIEEFQARLLTASMRDDIGRNIHALLYDLDTQLEMIRFSYDEAEHLAKSSKIVNEFLMTVTTVQ